MCNIYVGCRVNEKIKYYLTKTKFCARIRNDKSGNGIEYQPGEMQGYICNMKRVVDTAQYKTT